MLYFAPWYWRGENLISTDTSSLYREHALAALCLTFLLNFFFSLSVYAILHGSNWIICFSRAFSDSFSSIVYFVNLYVLLMMKVGCSALPLISTSFFLASSFMDVSASNLYRSVVWEASQSYFTNSVTSQSLAEVSMLQTLCFVSASQSLTGLFTLQTL